MCVCVRACMSTMPRLCCYRMELWPLSCQHSCVAIGLGVHGSSRRLRDNNLPTLFLHSLGVTMPFYGSTHHPESDVHDTGLSRVSHAEPASRSPTQGREYGERGFLLKNMLGRSVCWLSVSCAPYYPISYDSLSEETRRL